MLGALLLTLFASTALASAGIQVNKTFTPNSVALGGTSTVTVTLQNDSTSSSAAITSFSDDVGTMTGHGTLLTSPVPTTTCVGGTPAISGQVLSMNNGTIPIAPNASTLGTCTITFSVKGSIVGNGFNTIAAADVVTSLGSPTSDVTQTLAVQAANVTAVASSPGSVQMGGTNTVTYVVTNPASVPLTNVTLPITSNATNTYTITNATITPACGGTFGLPASGITGTTTFSGLTIPASGTCSVTLSVTSASAQTVNFALVASSVSDDQGATNTAGFSGQAVFVSGKPNIAKSFAPTAVAQNGTSTLTITVQNVLTDKPLTNAAFSDILPAGLTLSSTPVANANGFCGTPTLGGNGTGTLTFSGGTISTNKTCTITASVTTGTTIGSVTNTIPTTGTGSFTSTEANGSAAAANASLNTTGAGGGISDTITATPATTGFNSPLKLTLGFTSLAGGVFNGGTFTFNVPQTAQPMVAVTSGGIYAPTFSAGCGSSSPAVAFGGTGGNTTVTGSNLALASGGACSVSFYVQFSTTTAVSRTDLAAITNTNVVFTGTGGNVSPAGSPSVTLTEQPTLSTTNYVASATGPLNQQITVSGTVNDVSGTADTSAVAVFNLTAGKVQLAPTPNFTFGGTCPAGLSAANISVTANREQFTVTIGAIGASCTIGYDVINETGVAAGSYTPGNSTYSSTLTGGTAIPSTGQNNVSFATTTINVTKAFSPNQIQSGGISTADITLGAPQAGSLSRTQVNGVTFSDALPANMSFSPTPNVTFTAGCQQTGQPAPAFSIAGSTITFSNISLLTVGTTQTACDAKFDVTSSVVGAPLNQLNAGSVTSTSGTTNTQVAKASLTVNAGLGIAKTFVNPTMQIGGTNYVRFLVTNSATSAALSAGTLTDTLPASLVLASTTLGTIQAGDPALCGGSVAGPVGTGTVSLSGLAVAGEVGTTPSQCVVYVLLKASGSAASGSVTNTIAVGALNAGGYSNQTTAAASMTLTPPGAPTLTKTFTPTTIAPNGTSVVSISVANTATASAALSGVALTDTLPTGITVAATPTASTTCAPGTLTAVAGATSFGLAGGTLAANATCTITVSVTGTTAGSYVNTLAASALTTTQGATNASATTATLSIPSITLSKAFAPAAISAGGSSVLTISIPNTASGAVALTGVGLSDTLPTGVTIAAAPNAATTCGAGSVTAVAGGASVALTAGSLAASATCTVRVSVTGTAAATYTNTIAANALSTTQGITNPTAATANLAIALNAITLSNAFSPASIPAGGRSTLTITIPNTSPGAVALTGVALSDALPSGVTIAATPNASTNCPAGTVTAAAGGSSVALGGGTLAANATCTISVDVTGTVAATYPDPIPANALTTTQGVTNSAAATASLTIVPAAITLVNAFSPASITAGGTSTLTITIPNTSPGAVALTGLALSDTLPAGVTIAATPNASTTCGEGTATATAGGSTIALTTGSINASEACTITVSVTGTSAATYTNTIPASGLTDTQGITNAAASTANLTIAPAGIALATAFLPASIAAGGTSTLTITIPNTSAGAVALTNLTLSDTLPTGVTIAATPNASTTCGEGTATASGGSSTIALTTGSIAANATCAITVDVTGTAAATYTNTIAASGLTDAEGVTNAAAATANLTITRAAITLGSGFSPATIAAAGTSVLTITIPNTVPGAVALTGVGLTDTLPSGVTIAATPNAATTCPSGTATATAGSTSLVLAGGTLAANATCAISVSVTGTIAASYTNTIAPSALTDSQGVSNAVAATANLAITLAPIALSEAFAPAAIAAGGTSTLTITIPNTAAGAVALSGIAVSDVLPSGVTVAATPNASTTCTGGSLVITAGQSVRLTNGTLAANATCTISLDVTGTAAATYTNSIAAGALTTTEGASNSAAATANLTINLSAITLSKAFAPATISAGGTSVLTITIPNTAPGAVALSGVSLTDTLPSGLTIAATPGAATTCASGTVTAAAGDASVALAGGTLAASATCTITVNVTGTTAASYTNTIAANALVTTQGVSNSAAATANLTINLAAIALSKAFLPATIPAGGTSVLTISIPNTAAGAVALTGVAFTDTLPSGVTIAATPTAATTCLAGTVTAVAGGTSVALASGTLAANATCTVTVSVTGTVAATYTNTIAANALATTQGVSNSAPATANLTIALAPVTLSEAFLPATIAAGGTSVLTISIPNTAAGNVALSGVALSDALPSGITIAATPNASTTCGEGTVTATAGGTSIALAGGTLAAAETCTITVSVTGTVAATYTNTIAANALSTTQGVSNASAATANLSIHLAGTTLSEAFLPATIVAGGTSVLTISIPNTAVGAVALSAVALTDALPSGVTIAATPNASTTCGEGSVTATAGGTSLALAGGTLAAGATCTITVSVTGTLAATYTNTIAADALSTTQGVSNTAAATATLTIQLAGTTLSEAFAPATIAAGGTSALTISIPNTAVGAVALSGVALTDALPSGITIAATPNAATTCGEGTVTATAGGTSLALGSGTLAAGATCTITVSVTGTIAATYTNAIAANALSTTQGVSNATAATANLTIQLAGTTLSEAFAPATIAAGGTSALTISIPNTAAGAVALTGVALADALPSGVTIAATPNSSTTCGEGFVTATAGGTSLALAGGTLAAGATCTITVSVTGTLAATYTNTIAADALSTTQGVSNTAAATADLTIHLAGTTLSEAFAPATIAAGGTSILTISIPNTAAGAVALSGVALTDALPSGVTIAATPNASTTCGEGSVTAAAGGTSLALGSGTLAAGATCTITVSVTGTVAATYTNTIAADALSTTQGVSNAAAATADLTIHLAGTTLSEAFAPATIAAGGTSILTISIPNTAAGAVALSGVALTDALPSGVTIAATPNASTTCGEGSVTATAGGTSLALASGSVAAGATCTITVSVTGTVAATYTNTIAVNALSTTQGVSNAAPATANLTIQLAGTTLAEAFSPATIAAGGTSVLTISIPNTAAGAVALTGVSLSDALPSGVTIAATPNSSTTCGEGSVTAAAGGTSLALASGTLAAGATCTITVNVTGTVAATYTNTIAANALSTTQGVSNATAATANLTIAPAGIILTNAFTPATIAAGSTSLLTITIPNTSAGAVALTGVTLGDALPSGLTIAATPNATTNCGTGTASATAGGTTIALANGTLAAGITCTITVNVTGTVASTYADPIAANALITAQHVTNPTAATASLTVTALSRGPLTLSKAFAPSSIVLNATSTLTATIANTGTNAVALTSLSFADGLPSGVVLAAVPDASTTCAPGIVAATAGGTTFSLSGGTLAAGATCTVSVAATSAATGAYTDTSAVGVVSDTENVSNAVAASASLTVTTAAGLAVTQSFTPASIVPNAMSTLRIVFANTGSGNVALSSLALGDSLPAGVTFATVANAATTCISGTASATNTRLTLTGATLAAGATCTLSANVTSATPAMYTNTIAAGAVTTAQGATNAASAASLIVATVSNPTVAMSFAPATIVTGGLAQLTVTIGNAGVDAVALSALRLTDMLPTGVTLAANPRATTTCTSGTIAAAAGGGSLTLSRATLAAGATCTLSVDVTSSVAAAYTNEIGGNAIVDAQHLTNLTSASAELTVVAPSLVTIANNFSPATIVAGQSSLLTISLANTGGNAVMLTNVTLDDALPSGMTIAASPSATTTCPAGAVTAASGASAVALAGATLAASASCTLSVSVTSTTVGSSVDTIPVPAFGNVQNVASAGPASATLSVTGITTRTLTLSKAFSPASIVASGLSTLTLTIANSGSAAIALTELALRDTLPANTAIASVPNAATTCGAGSVSTRAGASSFALAGGTLAAGATCTVSVVVTSAVSGNYTDTSAAGSVTDAQSVSNAAAVSATLGVSAAPSAPAVTLSQAFAPATIPAGSTSQLTLSFANTAARAVPLTAMALTDALPAGVVLAAAPNAVTTCPGAVITALGGGARFSTSAGTLAAHASCTVTVTVIATAAGTYNNALAAGTLTTAQGATNSASQATLVVTASAPALRVTKTSDVAGADVSAGQTIAYTVNILNSGSAPETVAKITDVLANAKLVPGSVRVNGASAPDAIVSAGASFGSIAAGATVTIAYRAIVDASVANGATVTNSATVGGAQACAGAGCSATAQPDVVRAPPKLTVSLLIDRQTSEVVKLGQIVTYSATVSNVGGTDAHDVVLSDTLPAGIEPIVGSVTTPTGSATSTTAETNAASARNFAASASVDGQTVSASLGTIAAGGSQQVVFRAKITQPIPRVAVNIVTVGATGIPNVLTSNTVVATMVRSVLTVTKTASSVVARSGDRIDYIVHVAAAAGVALGRTKIVDQFPDYLLFAPGTARVNGVVTNPQVVGHTLTWTLPAFGAGFTLTYATSIAAGVPANTTLSNLVTVNAAATAAAAAATGSASASVQVVASTFGSCYPITGRVYDDAKQSGRFEAGDTGLAGVSIVLDDGESVVTDAYGRYNFPCVRPGMHALRLDESTLPAGSAAYADRAIDSERSTRRLVHSTFDATILQDINFAIGRAK